MTANKSDGAEIPRREFIKRSATVLVATSLPASNETLAQQTKSIDAQSAAADDVIPVRTITAGVNVATDSYAEVLADASNFLAQAQGIVEAQGFPVQTTRITTQPHAFLRKVLRTIRMKTCWGRCETLSETIGWPSDQELLTINTIR